MVLVVIQRMVIALIMDKWTLDYVTNDAETALKELDQCVGEFVTIPWLIVVLPVPSHLLNVHRLY